MMVAKLYFYLYLLYSGTVTGSCPGQIALSGLFGPETVNIQPIIGGTGKYKAAQGQVKVTYVTEPSKCPLKAPVCFYVEINLV